VHDATCLPESIVVSGFVCGRAAPPNEPARKYYRSNARNYTISVAVMPLDHVTLNRTAKPMP
ncbi:hypothetical protein WN51_10873, partial [Melipona quadrifasciata]